MGSMTSPEQEAAPPARPAPTQPPAAAPQGQEAARAPKPPATPMPPEIGGPAGPEPTRFGDWEQKGRCTDF